MTGILLQVAHDHAVGVEGISFTVEHIITIVGGVVATLTAFLTLKLSFNAFKEATGVRFDVIETNYKNEVKRLTREYDEKLLNVKHGKNAIKKELSDKIDKLEEVTKLRIDKTQERMEKFQTQNQNEFKSINETLNKIVGLLEGKG